MYGSFFFVRIPVNAVKKSFSPQNSTLFLQKFTAFSAFNAKRCGRFAVNKVFFHRYSPLILYYFLSKPRPGRADFFLMPGVINIVSFSTEGLRIFSIRFCRVYRLLRVVCMDKVGSGHLPLGGLLRGWVFLICKYPLAFAQHLLLCLFLTLHFDPKNAQGKCF